VYQVLAPQFSVENGVDGQVGSSLSKLASALLLVLERKVYQCKGVQKQGWWKFLPDATRLL